MGTKEFFKRLMKYKMAKIILIFLLTTILVGIYAPFFASSKPLVVCYQNKWYFPFFKTLFYRHYYTHSIDIFFNISMVLLPFGLIFLWVFKRYTKLVLLGLVMTQCILFYFVNAMSLPWLSSDFSKSSPYAKIEKAYLAPTNDQVSFYLPTLGVQAHWQENIVLSEKHSMTPRLNGHSLWASLFFGIRTSLFTALGATFLAFGMGITLGALAGFLGKTYDLIIGRMIEIWESIPPLFIILLMVSQIQNVSTAWVIVALALFSWTSIARMVRLEILKQKSLPYVDVLFGFGYRSKDVLFKHVLSKTMPSLIALMPFALMGAMTYEAALSFLGLGDRSGCSLGLLLDEARMIYPMQTSLFWPPALLMMLWLLALTWLGDLCRRVLKMGERTI